MVNTGFDRVLLNGTIVWPWPDFAVTSNRRYVVTGVRTSVCKRTCLVQFPPNDKPDWDSRQSLSLFWQRYITEERFACPKNLAARQAWHFLCSSYIPHCTSGVEPWIDTANSNPRSNVITVKHPIIAAAWLGICPVTYMHSILLYYVPHGKLIHFLRLYPHRNVNFVLNYI